MFFAIISTFCHYKDSSNFTFMFFSILRKDGLHIYLDSQLAKMGKHSFGQILCLLRHSIGLD
jgi:hypothetical protein